MDDSDPDQIDYNDPACFSRLFGPGLPVPTYQSPAAVRKQARERSQTIHDTSAALRDVVIRHEDTIQKRWMKKSRQQRLKILLECWPGMAAIHHPDFDAFRKENGQLRSGGTRYRDHYLWPYINQEDLCKPKNILLLLNARARHHASAFAAADITAIRLGITSTAIVPIYLNEYVMILNCATDVDSYGKVINWDDHEDAFDWMHTQKQFLPGEGLLVLEIQERILKFLLAFCKAVLRDIPVEALKSDTYQIQPEPHLKTEIETNGFDSLAVMAAEAPYRLPARIDFARIDLLLEAKVSAAKDHIWALREDPDYFANRVNDIEDHRQEMLKDTKGNIHPALRPGRQNILGARVVGNLIVEAYSELEIFAELHRQGKELRLLHEKYASQLSPCEDLPKELLGHILAFRYFLTQAAKGPLSQLLHNVSASPPLRRLFVRQPPPNATTSKIAIMSVNESKRTAVEGRLLWLLNTLWENGRTLFLAGMPLILDELQRFLEAEPEAANLVSSRIAEMISNASIISQCLSQLDQFQPWARSFENAEADQLDEIQQKFAVWAKPLGNIIHGLQEQYLLPVADLASTSQKRFFYPVEKRRTKDTVEALRQAEENLDRFWQAADKIVDSRCKHLEGTAARALFSGNRVLQRTPEWVPQTSKETPADKKVGPVQTVDSVEELSKPLSTLYFGSTSGQRISQEPKPKTKTKTKGLPSSDQTAPLTISLPIEASEPAPTIAVDPRSLKVFRTLFFNPGVTSSPGEIPWQDFVHAMTSTGLFAAEKLYGSAWQFQRLDGKLQTRIQFHQPHPRGKIPFTNARRMGRRLTRVFGWVGDMFVVKGE